MCECILDNDCLSLEVQVILVIYSFRTARWFFFHLVQLRIGIQPMQRRPESQMDSNCAENLYYLLRFIYYSGHNRSNELVQLQQ